MIWIKNLGKRWIGGNFGSFEMLIGFIRTGLASKSKSRENYFSSFLFGLLSLLRFLSCGFLTDFTDRCEKFAMGLY